MPPEFRYNRHTLDSPSHTPVDVRLGTKLCKRIAPAAVPNREVTRGGNSENNPRTDRQARGLTDAYRLRRKPRQRFRVVVCRMGRTLSLETSTCPADTQCGRISNRSVPARRHPRWPKWRSSSRAFRWKRLSWRESFRQGLPHTDGEFLAKRFTVAALLSFVQESLGDGLKQPYWCPPSPPDLVSPTTTTLRCRRLGVLLPLAASRPNPIHPVRLAVSRSRTRVAEPVLQAEGLPNYSSWV